jgi:hypothetical protein
VRWRVDISNCGAAQLLKDMLRLGISAYHPNSLAAIEAKKRSAR